MTRRAKAPWSTNEIADAKAAYERGDHLDDIADMLGRSSIAVRTRATESKWRRPTDSYVRNRNLPPMVRFIDEERRRQGLTIAELVHKAGIGQTTYTHWFAGRTIGTWHNVEAVLGALGYRITIEQVETARAEPSRVRSV